MLVVIAMLIVLVSGASIGMNLLVKNWQARQDQTALMAEAQSVFAYIDVALEQEIRLAAAQAMQASKAAAGASLDPDADPAEEDASLWKEYFLKQLQTNVYTLHDRTSTVQMNDLLGNRKAKLEQLADGSYMGYKIRVLQFDPSVRAFQTIAPKLGVKPQEILQTTDLAFEVDIRFDKRDPWKRCVYQKAYYLDLEEWIAMESEQEGAVLIDGRTGFYIR